MRDAFGRVIQPPEGRPGTPRPVVDRVGRNDVDLSHRFLAMMLGVRRRSVTVVAGALQTAGLLTSEHGHV